jgi:iron complex transport system substrate-binding protein
MSRASVLSLAMAATLTLTGTSTSTAASSRASSAPVMRDVVDGTGRHVQVPDRPHRVIALTPSLAETIYSLGGGGDLVGVTDHSDYPPEARDHPSVGGIVDPSIERIVALSPDLVIASLESNRKDTVDALERLRIPVFVVNPEGLSGVLLATRQIGGALHRTPEATELIDRLESRRASVARRLIGRSKPRVFVLIWPDPVVTVGRHAFITEVVEAAGGNCVTSDLSQPWPRLSLEEVVRRAPDTLLLIKGGHPTLAVSDFASRPGWDQVPAVRANRFVEIDARLEHSSPLVFDALEDMARALHPDVILQ